MRSGLKCRTRSQAGALQKTLGLGFSVLVLGSASVFVLSACASKNSVRDVAQKKLDNKNEKKSPAPTTTVVANPKGKVKRPFGDENLQMPKAIKVTRASPIFDAPRTRAKVLADVDVDTVLIAREVSKKGAWLKVEDEDGNAGWMPRSRTNFNMLFAPDADPTPDPTPDPKEVNEARNDFLKQADPPQAPSNHLHFVSVAGGTIGGGVAYTFFQKLNSFRASERSAYFGVQVGGYRFWDFKKDEKTYTPFFRFRWLGRDRGSDFVSGPDLGVSFRLPRKNWVGALGYSWGWAPDLEKGGFGLLLRPSVEIGGPSRFGIESEAGWSF